MKCIKQFRYYGEGNSKNYPVNTMTSQNLIRNNIFAGYGSITQMGIQGRPGTTLYLNNSIYPIVIGQTGIYEIDLEDYDGQIYAIRFAASSLATYDEEGNTDRLLIDIIYEGSGADA